MRKYILILILLVTTLVTAQRRSFEISGTVISEDKNPLESATVYLEGIKDSTLVTYTISDKNGAFILENHTYEEKLRLLISYMGYKPYSKVIKIDKEKITLDPISLDVDTNELDEVIVQSTPPITIKKDTLEFNVKSFKAKRDATIEDLLKVLPGVEVDEEGNITVNGKPVNRILVNGKPFFGNDPTITTRNLSKDIVEKVQVVDTKTKAEAFTGEKGDDENKTINLTIKKENNKGVFGRLSAGAGTNERYEYAGMFNRFDNDQRISVLAGGNNINSPGFSFGEIRKMFGGSNVRFSGGEGITTSRNAGVNYADELGHKKDISANYFHSDSKSENKTISQRENILPDSRYFTNSESFSLNDSNNHNANMEFDIEIDSTLLINFRPSFRYSNNKTVFSRNEESLNELGELTNESTTRSVAENVAKNLSNGLDVTKKFGSNGAYLRLNMNYQYATRESDDYLQSETYIYGDNPEDIIRDQYTDGNNENNNINTGINYNLPIISKELFLNFGFRYSRNEQDDTQSTFDKDVNGNFTVFNEDLSTDFQYINELRQPEASIDYRNKKWSTNFRTTYLFRTLENKDLLRTQYNIKRDFEAVELRYRFRYQFSPKSTLYLGYRLNNDPPQLNQLQAFQNVSNPLNTVIGNPNLEPTNNHSFYGGYNGFDFQKQTGFNSSVRANFYNNAIVRKTTVNEDFVRETTYANVSGNYNLFANLGYNKSVKIDSLHTIKGNISLNGSANRNINFNNDLQYASYVTSIAPGAGITYNWKDIMEIMSFYNVSFTKNQYDIDEFEDRKFMVHSIFLSTATYFPKHFEWRNELTYNYNSNIAPGFQKSSWFWNATLAYSMLKDKATITLKAYDILNQNTNARRIATEDYIQDSQNTVLQQYFMLSFSWKFNTLGSKGDIREHDHRFRH